MEGKYNLINSCVEQYESPQTKITKHGNEYYTTEWTLVYFPHMLNSEI